MDWAALHFQLKKILIREPAQNDIEKVIIKEQINAKCPKMKDLLELE